jgi:nicotinamidase/pyrazinamidase
MHARSNTVRGDDTGDGFAPRHGLEPRCERDVRHRHVHSGGAGVAADGGGTNQRAARRAEIIQHDHGRMVARHADERTPRDDAPGAALLDEGKLDFAPEPLLEELPEELRTLDAADVRRSDDQRGAPEMAGEMMREHGEGAQMIHGDAERVVEGGRVVDVERDEAIGARRLEKLRHVAGIDRVTKLGSAILARIGEIRDERNAALCARIAQSAQEEQQPNEPFRGRSVLAAGERLQDERGTPTHGLERSQLELAPIEASFLEWRKRDAGFAGHLFGQLTALAQGHEARQQGSAHASISHAAPRAGNAAAAQGESPGGHVAGAMHTRPLQPGPGDVLVVADVQNDFLPGGALAVLAGDEVVPVLNRYLGEFERLGLPVFATRDWHPPGHCSFREQGGPWPPHCIAGTRGAQFTRELALPATARLISKATRADAEAYSAFEGTDLAAQMRQVHCSRVFIGGLTTDYCVRATALDALALGLEVVVLEDAIRAVDVHPGDGQLALQELAMHGVRLAHVEQVLA